MKKVYIKQRMCKKKNDHKGSFLGSGELKIGELMIFAGFFILFLENGDSFIAIIF